MKLDIKRIRKEKGISQEELAEKSGVSRPTISNLENNPDAVIDLNEIRKRAYGNDEHKYTAAEGDLQLAIFREREKELLFEDHRFYDIRRNGIDYVRRELPEAFGKLTDQDIKDGALYMDIALKAMTNNDLMRHNVYWNKFLQK